MESELQRLESALNETMGKGQILEALAEFYADDCTFEEGDGARREGKQAQHDHLSGFFATLKGFNGATLHGQGVGDGISLSEWTFDMTGSENESIIWNEVLVRRWRNGKVVAERFYPAS